MTIYLDFDGTCVEHEYPKIGRLNEGSIEVLEKLYKANHTIILNTYRADLKVGLEDAVNYSNKHFNIQIYSVQFPKINPPIWDLETAIKEDILFIDDISEGIPLKKAVMTNYEMVDWYELDKQFIQYNIY